MKFQGLKDLGSGPISKCQKLTYTHFLGALERKLDCTSLNEIRCTNRKEGNDQESIQFSKTSARVVPYLSLHF